MTRLLDFAFDRSLEIDHEGLRVFLSGTTFVSDRDLRLHGERAAHASGQEVEGDPQRSAWVKDQRPFALTPDSSQGEPSTAASNP